MELNFHKLQGTGNDFVLLDFISEAKALSSEQIQFLCDRHFGVGSDGLLVLTNTDQSHLNFHLTFYNPDGSESFCGNGSRAAAKYYCLFYNTNFCSFSAFDGEHQAFAEDDNIKLEMRIGGSIDHNQYGRFINTGAPHVCVETAELSVLEINEKAKAIRWDKQFMPVGVNVNFYEKSSDNRVNMRTFEKGVEGETLSCGTGVTAVAISFFDAHPEQTSVQVSTKGGLLTVEKDADQANKYWLTGPAHYIFKGSLSL